MRRRARRDKPRAVDLYENIKRNHRGAVGWTQGRLRYFAVASSVLSGFRPDRLPIEIGALVAAAQGEVARFLRFLARRADVRELGAPDVAVAASDMATALEFGTGERGGGALLEVMKRAYQPDETRHRKVLEDYGRCVSRGVDSLDAALPHLALRSREAVEQRPQLQPSVTTKHGSLVLQAGSARRPTRIHTRVATPSGCPLREIVHRAGWASLGEVELGPVAELGRPGPQQVAVELFAGALGGAAWSYATCEGEVRIPAPPIDFDGARKALRSRNGAEHDSTHSKGFLHRIGEAVFGASPMDAARQQIQEAPPRVKKAATVLAKCLSAPPDKAMAVRALIEPYERVVSRDTPRPLSLIADEKHLTQFEAAVLATALLRHMGVEAELVPAQLDGDNAALCTWRYAGRTYGLPIWPTRYVRVDGAAKLQAWADEHEHGAAPAVGWEVLRDYQRLSRRSLPFELGESPKTSGAATGGPAVRQGSPRSSPPAAAPACPECGSPMRQRSGRFGRFWGCSRYPTCKRTLEM